MSSIFVHLSAEAGHWRIGFNINGKVQPAEVFACRSGLDPLLRGLRAAETEYDRVGPLAEGDARRMPTTIAVRMPSGRVLSFRLYSVQETISVLPEG